MPEDALSPKRQQILEKLQSHHWYNSTNPDLQKELLNLPEDHNDFLTDLANRSDELDNLDIIRLVSLSRGNFLLIPTFEVRSHDTNQSFTYEYVSWKHGPNPGGKVTIFVEVDGQIKYFLTKQITKFSTNKRIYDSIGGFIAYENKELKNLPENIQKELLKRLGLEKLNIDAFMDLGYMYPDMGMTNNHTALYAAIIDGDEAKNIQHITEKPLKTLEISFKLDFQPIENLRKFIFESDDSYFLATILRLAAKGIIEI